MIKKIMLALTLFTAVSFSSEATEMSIKHKKIYIDDSEFKAQVDADAFHIHIGDNLWLVTNTVHRDASGLFTFEDDLLRVGMDFEKKWKCPYCYKYWPEGKPCGNKECPSKYK